MNEHNCAVGWRISGFEPRRLYCKGTLQRSCTVLRNIVRPWGSCKCEEFSAHVCPISGFGKFNGDFGLTCICHHQRPERQINSRLHHQLHRHACISAEVRPTSGILCLNDACIFFFWLSSWTRSLEQKQKKQLFHLQVLHRFGKIIPPGYRIHKSIGKWQFPWNIT
jgi:hypothetical protein